MRERPPEVVSPLMLALTTRAFTFLFDHAVSLQQGHPAGTSLETVFGAERVAHHQNHRQVAAGGFVLGACASAWPKDPAAASAHTLQTSALK